ncbi:hypothetical protein BDV96DRAFT_331506 [Lophiotrema nucula]|uniref:Uncharacterized protein n=1 Tax=Lophiotrema nucula TaxID=690887 RepID=A0A6A5YI87_9PLEO|nr:hypothetical protein BDV96DRAFT_331506 [Lophiotrema nucula]
MMRMTCYPPSCHLISPIFHLVFGVHPIHDRPRRPTPSPRRTHSALLNHTIFLQPHFTHLPSSPYQLRCTNKHTSPLHPRQHFLPLPLDYPRGETDVVTQRQVRILHSISSHKMGEDIATPQHHIISQLVQQTLNRESPLLRPCHPPNTPPPQTCS